jgi:hypothetical protein
MKMFEGKAPFWTSPQDSGALIPWVCGQLESAGYQLMRSFDLQQELPDPKAAAPVEGDQAGCSCRLVVILIYGQSGPPISLMFIESYQNTSLYLMESGSTEKSSCSCDSIARVLVKSLEKYETA